MQDRLYYQDAYIKCFESKVIEKGQDAHGRPFLILSNTAFYPTGGGQPHDLGTINGVPVIDVEELEGNIVHFLEKALPDASDVVQGSIDWERRFDHMQQHAGQHILSAAFQDLFEYPTLSFHLGKEVVTIDIDTADVSAEELAAAVQKANEIVLLNLPIQTKWVEASELTQYPLRKPPKVTSDIRLVIIEGIDYNACGGTHPRRTGEVGPIQILGTERMKNKTRVSFLCGWRAIKSFQTKHHIIKILAQQLNRPEEAILSSVDDLLTENAQLKAELEDVKNVIIQQEAKQLVNNAQILERSEKLIARFFIDRSINDLQKLSYAIKDEEPHALILFTALNDNKLQLIASRGSALDYNMNSFIKKVLPLIDGRGGGKPDHAQGGGEAKMTASALLEHLKNALTGKEPVS